jgi:hypothetical protein
MKIPVTGYVKKYPKLMPDMDIRCKSNFGHNADLKTVLVGTISIVR